MNLNQDVFKKNDLPDNSLEATIISHKQKTKSINSTQNNQEENNLEPSNLFNNKKNNTSLSILNSSNNNINSNFISKNSNNNPLIKKKKSQSKIDPKNYREVDIILDLYTIILKKEDAEKCICRNTFPMIDDLNTENNKNLFYESEIISSLNFLVYQNDKIKLFDVISKLKNCGYPLTGSMISIYSKLADDYVFIGADPIDQNFFISNSEYNIKLIKFRIITYIEDKLIQEITEDQINNNEDGFVTRINSFINKKKNKRTKERKIGYIIEKVNSWRKLYNGFYDENGKFTKYSLDEAAKIIGISKKSLDDYLLQLRLGRKFGFDFNTNKNQKVGILRSYVKQNRGQKNE